MEGPVAISHLPMITAKRPRVGSNSHKDEKVTDRRGRNGVVRPIPKKGGAGGKGVWGKPGDELRGAVETLDRYDPNYDPAEYEPYELEETMITLSPSQRDLKIRSCIDEYFQNGVGSEVDEYLRNFEADCIPSDVVVKAVEMAYERHDPERELVSLLIAELAASNYISSEEIGKSFEQLLDTVDDTQLDTPDAPQLLARFIARAVADDCLPPSFLSIQLAHVDTFGPGAREATRTADVLLNMKHGLVRLDSVWGQGGGRRPVRQLRKKIVMLVKEFLNADDLAEAERCVRELNVPHFHHEIVYESVVCAIEGLERDREPIARLLKCLADSNLITPEQMRTGFERVIANLDDLVLDVPNAHRIFGQFVRSSVDAGYLAKSIFGNNPPRNRKRFVSEGDGGRFKYE
eukprot:Opistho-2@17748